MLTVVVHVRDYDQATAIRQQSPQADAFEWRLDGLRELDSDAIAAWMQLDNRPCILTLRPTRQGGEWHGCEQTRLSWLRRLLQLQPVYLDVEADLAEADLVALHQHATTTQLIRSTHHFGPLPANLDALLASQIHPLCAHSKLALRVDNTLELLTVLRFARQHGSQHRLSVIALGAAGSASRILSPVIGNQFHYCTPDGQPPNAAGQLPLSLLTERYRIKQLNPDTQCYALLGDPVNTSLGDQWHNRAFAQQGRNAVYLKLKLASTQMAEFLRAAHDFPFAGFSVTMPNKISALAAAQTLSPLVKHIGAANTLSRRPYGWHASNTDGWGALAVIRRHSANLHTQKILLIGCGGTARAIALALSLAGAQLTLINRTDHKAQQLAAHLTANWTPWQQLDKQLRNPALGLVVNTTPWTEIPPATAPILHCRYHPHQASHGLNGLAMFNAQASYQQQLWQDIHHNH